MAIIKGYKYIAKMPFGKRSAFIVKIILKESAENDCSMNLADSWLNPSSLLIAAG